MKNSKIAAAALVAALPLATIAATAGTDSADAATAPQARITALVHNQHPTFAHVFRVTGTFTENGKPAANHLVKIKQQFPNGSWHQIKGAQVLTNAKGDYSVGVVLNFVRNYHLRAVGVGKGSQPTARHGFHVRVYN